MKEIIVDNFAGGGGASTGIEMATGRSVDIAINHDENAIAMHSTNHPETLHYCESVFDVDPIAATAGRPVGLAWFSPDCRHFSKAKGSKPVKKEIRGLAWIVIRWALAKRPRVMMLENVEEFKTWGPLLTAEDGSEHPDPARAGETFAAFIGMLTTGIAADHPAIAECCEVLNIDVNSNDVRRLVAGLGYVVDHRELRACDFGAPTIRRRFFMVMRCDGQPLDEPLQTITKTHGYAVVEPKFSPHITKFRTGATGQEVDEPLPTITAGSSERPGGNGHALGMVEATLSPFIAGTGGSEYQGKPRATDVPLHTVMKESHSALIAPVIARIGQTGFGGDRMAYAAGKPLTTVTSKAEHLLVAPVIARQFGNSVGHAADEPNGTITAGGGGKSQLCTAFLAKHFGGNYTGAGAAMDAPAHTVTTTDHHALVTSNLIKLRGTCKDGQPVTQPAPTITAGGLHIGEVRAFLLKYYGNEKEGVSLDESLHTVTTNDRFGLVTVEGVDYQIVDIGMRMLQPHELYAAQGFPSWYIIDQDYRGKKYAKDKQVARCGNAVPPPFAEALVRANLPEMCGADKEVAA